MEHKGGNLALRVPALHVPELHDLGLDAAKGGHQVEPAVARVAAVHPVVVDGDGVLLGP